MSDPTAHLADFVLKLKFEGTDEASTQIRRVRLPRICSNSTGAVSYEELVGLAISFVIPETPVHASDFQVKLTYKDVDDDLVVIGSSEELLDAIDQYKEQRVLRITAEVKHTRTSTTPPVPQQTSEEVPLGRAFPDNTCQLNDAVSDAGAQAGNATNAARVENTTSPMLQNVVESVVNVILNAAVSINSRNQGSPRSHPVYTPEGVLSQATAAVVSPPCSTHNDTVTDTPVVEEDEPPPAEVPVQDSEPAVPPAELEAVVPTEEPAQAPVEEAKQEPVENAPAEEDKEDERPFIHGRHTCDSCLTTPIIGKRFHAINMSDYDLCEKCYYETTGGSEIQFEAFELERDRHLQDRWHRRRDRMNNGSGRGAVRRFGPRGHHHRWGPGAKAGAVGGCGRGLSNGPPPPHRRPQGPPPHFGQPPHPKAWKSREEQKVSEENAMAMAIKLSLQDMQEKEAAAPIKAAPPAKDPPAGPKPPPQPSATVEEELVESSTAAAKPASLKSDVEKEKEVALLKEEPMEPEPHVTPETSAPMEEEVKFTPASPASTAAPVQVETVEDDEQVEQEEEASTGTDAFVVRMPSDDGSFSCDVSFIENQPPKAPTPTNDGSRESSFSSDAAGNGEIADMLGETLDKCAEAIDAMVSELDRTSFEVASSIGTSLAGVQEPQAEEEAETPAEGGEPEEGREAEGATILESVGEVRGEEKDAVSAAQSEEDWHVVSEDQQVSSDEELARAAQMIGSALFNSDMRSSGEVMSALTGSAEESDAISYASSALTSLPSVNTQQVAAAQRQRWAKQLAQLHELGFDDDIRCVEILERLSAANIGCGSDDEVSVRQVIDALWK